MTADRYGQDDGTFVIRPSWATYRAQRAGPWAVIPLTIAALLPLGRLGWFGLYLGIVVVAPAAYLLWRYFRCLRVEVGEAQIVYGGYLRTRRWSRAELARVLVVDDLNLSKLEVAHEWVIALDRAGRRMFQLRRHGQTTTAAGSFVRSTTRNTGQRARPPQSYTLGIRGP